MEYIISRQTTYLCQGREQRNKNLMDEYFKIVKEEKGGEKCVRREGGGRMKQLV